MNIQLDDNWSIETDRFCFVLKNQYKSEKGKLYNNITYHPTIAKALKAYVSESTKECLSVNGILLKLEELEFKIDHLELPTLRQAQLRALSGEKRSMYQKRKKMSKLDEMEPKFKVGDKVCVCDNANTIIEEIIEATDNETGETYFKYFFHDSLGHRYHTTESDMILLP